MNKDQKTTAYFVAAVLTIMLMFPPTDGCGYKRLVNISRLCPMDIPRLLVQWLGVVLIGGLVWWAEKKEDDKEK